MNSSDFVKAFRDRLECAATCYHADGTDQFELGVQYGLDEALKILDGVEYEWGEMMSGRERENDRQVEKYFGNFLTYK